jgi:hypothetical protein
MKRLYQYILNALIFIYIAISAHAYDVTLAWNTNTEPNIIKYLLYVRFDGTGGFNLVEEITLDRIDPMNPQFTATGMENNITYDFVVTAVNDANLESIHSNEVRVINGRAVVPGVSSGGSGGGGGGCYISSTLCVP